MHKRHLVYYRLLHPLVVLFLWIRFGYRFKKAKNLPENYIVLSNHTTDYDPILVGASFNRQMYFVASEHIARWPLAYKFLKHCFAPIIRYKGTTATATVMEMLRAVKAGRNVCMFAEGNRSWDGDTAEIAPATGKVVKSARCGLVTYRIEGGYFVSPRWGKGLRRGRLYGAPVNVYTKEQIASMSVDEINEVINRDLHEDAYARQLEAPAKYKGKNPAEQLESLLFVCPGCCGVDTMHSQGDTVTCSNCSATFRYNEYGMLEGAPYKTVKEFAAWQREMVKEAAKAGDSYSAPDGRLVTVSQSVESLVAEGPVTLDRENFSCGEHHIPIEEILDLEMHGRRALVFSTKDAYYELKPSEEVSAVKFKLLYEAYKAQWAKNSGTAASGREKAACADPEKKKQEKQSM